MGFVVEVEVRPCAEENKGRGVFALAAIPHGTLLWTPNLLTSLDADELKQHLAAMDFESAHVYLRQGFVAPAAADRLQVNPTDDGRFVNHSRNPNCGACEDPEKGSLALRDIAAGEEITCDYSGFANPEWYVDLCRLYNVVSTADTALLFS